MIVISRRKPYSILLQDRAIIAHFYHSIFLIVQEITRELPCDFIFISKHQQTGSSRVVFFRQMYEFLSKQKKFYSQLAIRRDGDSDSDSDSLSVTWFLWGLPTKNRAFSVDSLQSRDTVSSLTLSLFRISVESIELTILQIPVISVHQFWPIPVHQFRSISVQSVGGLQYHRQRHIPSFFSLYPWKSHR